MLDQATAMACVGFTGKRPEINRNWTAEERVRFDVLDGKIKPEDALNTLFARMTQEAQNDANVEWDKLGQMILCLHERIGDAKCEVNIANNRLSEYIARCAALSAELEDLKIKYRMLANCHPASKGTVQ